MVCLVLRWDSTGTWAAGLCAFPFCCPSNILFRGERLQSARFGPCLRQFSKAPSPLSGQEGQGFGCHRVRFFFVMDGYKKRPIDKEKRHTARGCTTRLHCTTQAWHHASAVRHNRAHEHGGNTRRHFPPRLEAEASRPTRLDVSNSHIGAKKAKQVRPLRSGRRLLRAHCLRPGEEEGIVVLY
jgi:hypothetical protein